MISIGVTGHRHLSEIKNLKSSVNDALIKITSASDYNELQVLSSLAEGADRLVVSIVLESHNPHLIVPLPLNIPDYMLDFKSESSKKEFLILLEQAEKTIELPPKMSRQECYLAAGRYILKHCDILIAIWDGKPARGVGGTAEIVAEARNMKLPIAWIQTSLNDQVIYENFPFNSEMKSIIEI